MRSPARGISTYSPATKPLDGYLSTHLRVRGRGPSAATAREVLLDHLLKLRYADAERDEEHGEENRGEHG
jgi:hypothetical protein